MGDQVVFYQLSHKFVNNRENVPENARQVVYYSLAIGHHVGVLDCFCVVLEIPLEDYRHWLSKLPKGQARRKLEGILKWGEIEINRQHAAALLPALNSALPKMVHSEAQWAQALIECMQNILAEPALYLMARRRG